MTAGRLKALLPFTDDSTLFFALRAREMLEGTGIETDMGWLALGSDLSPRQLGALLPQGPDILLRNIAFRDIEALAEYDLMIVSRMFAQVRDMMRNPFLRHRADRPAVLAFQGGLDFDPERGFFNRRNADAVFVVPKTDVDRYRLWAEEAGLVTNQYVGFGHPTFLMPDTTERTARDIYFFAQAISPATYRGRLHIVQTLAAIARANPDRTVWLKLRHLPDENITHLHRETLPYTDLIADVGGAELTNLKLSAEPVQDVLPKTGIGITCTSTAAADLIRAGVPTMVYLDYVENYLDPLVEPMRRMFEDSGVITSLDDVLALRHQAPNPDWLANMFVSRDTLVDSIRNVMAHFRGRPDLTSRVVPVLDWR